MIKTITLRLLVTFICFCISLIACKHKSENPKAVTIDLPYKFKTEKAEYLSGKAFNLRREKKYDEAISLYKKAIVLEPDNPKLFFDVSECYGNNNELDKALSAIDTAIKLDSINPNFYNNRGLIYWRLSKDENAITDYKKAIELGSKSWVVYYNISIAYYINKKRSEACKTFKIAKELGLTPDFIAKDKLLIAIEETCK